MNVPHAPAAMRRRTGRPATARRVAVTALALAAAAAALSPCRAGPLLDQANALYQEGKLREAIRAYRRAGLSGESPALCSFNEGNAWFQLDSLSHALVAYRACVAAAPDYAKAYQNLAVAYFTLEDFGNCIAVLRDLLRLEPDHAKALLIMATAYRRVGAVDEAVIVFTDLTRLHPDMEEPFISLAEVYRDWGQVDDAIGWLLQCPKGGRNEGFVQVLLADLFERRGDLSRAVFHLNQALEHEPSQRWIAHRIVHLQARMGNGRVALETARSAFARFGDFAELAVLAGNVAFEMGSLGEAELWYARAAGLGSAAGVVGLGNVRHAMVAALESAHGTDERSQVRPAGAAQEGRAQ